MNRHLFFVLIIASVLTFIGCGSGRISTLDRGPKEAIVLGKLTILNDEKDVSAKSNILFDERLMGTYGVWPDDSNYIYLKLPTGTHFISLVQHYPFSKPLPDNYAVIDVPESKIYYIGDIVIRLNLSDSDETHSGVLGAVIDSKKEGANIPIEITDKYELAIQFFNQKFHNNNSIDKKLLKINAQ